MWLPLDADRPGSNQEQPWACEVIHYEAPFGVGYLVAQLTGKPALKEYLEQSPGEVDLDEESFEGANLTQLARALWRLMCSAEHK